MTIPPLATNLRRASFRGVPFQIENTEFEGGRRNQTHEFPQRDIPYTQDLGRSARRLEFNAFLVGTNYVAQVNSFLNALEAGGAGALVHPWFGTLTVNAGQYRVGFNRELGYAAVSVSFVESGALNFPGATLSTQSVTKAKATSLLAKLKAAFAGVFKTIGFINYVANQAIVIYGQVLQIMANPTFALASALGFSALPGKLSSLSALISNPSGLINAFTNLLNISGLAQTGVIGITDAITIPMVSGLTAMATAPALAPVAPPAYSTATMQQKVINQAAIFAGTRQTLLAQAVGLSSYIQCSVYDDTIACRNLLCAALDTEMLSATDDDLFLALQDARIAVYNDLTTRSENSARLLTITPPIVLPMLAIAYDYYQDTSRADEISARNKISNPGFVPVESLYVLSS